MTERPVDWDYAPASNPTTVEKTNLVPNELYRKGVLQTLLKGITPKTACRQQSVDDNVYWMHDRELGVIMGWNTTSDVVSIIRLRPASVGTVTGTASSEV